MALFMHDDSGGWVMAGDLGKHGQRDSIRVNILEAQELQAWCAEFGCTADQLKTAVSRAGVMATDVRAFLQDQDWIPRRGVRAVWRGCWRAGGVTADPAAPPPALRSDERADPGLSEGRA